MNLTYQILVVGSLLATLQTARSEPDVTALLNGLVFNASFSIKQGEKYIDHEAKLRWDPDLNRFTALPD